MYLCRHEIAMYFFSDCDMKYSLYMICCSILVSLIFLFFKRILFKVNKIEHILSSRFIKRENFVGCLF